MILLLLLFLSYSIQLLWLFFLLAYRKGNTAQAEKSNELAVSIIVCAHNEEAHIADLIQSIYHQEYQNFELIIVNDRSTDKTAEILKKYQSKFPQLRLVTINIDSERVLAPKKRALSEGIKFAKNPILLLTDADCIPASNQWIQGMLSAYVHQSTDIVLGVGRYIRRKGLLNLFIRYETLITAMQYLSSAVLGKAYMGVGRNLSYKAKLYIKNNGFKDHEHLISGDDDLFVNQASNTNNTAIVSNPLYHTFSEAKSTFRAWWKQKTRHLSVGNNYNLSSKLALGAIFVSHIGVYFLSLVVVLKVGNFLIVLSLFVFRALGLIFVVNKTATQWQEDIPKSIILILDFLHLLYQIVLGTAAFVSKRATWS